MQKKFKTYSCNPLRHLIGKKQTTTMRTRTTIQRIRQLSENSVLNEQALATTWSSSGKQQRKLFNGDIEEQALYEKETSTKSGMKQSEGKNQFDALIRDLGKSISRKFGSFNRWICHDYMTIGVYGGFCFVRSLF